MERNFDDCINTFKQHIDKFKSEIGNCPLILSKPIEFKLEDDLDKKLENISSKVGGIYLIELNLSKMYPELKSIKEKLIRFANDWEILKDSTRIIKKRYNKQLKNEIVSDWLYLYLGKNKDLRNRIIQHINLNKDSSTHALKLIHRQNLQNALFRVSTLELESGDYYDFIVPYIERTLRDKYNPIIGKQ